MQESACGELCCNVEVRNRNGSWFNLMATSTPRAQPYTRLPLNTQPPQYKWLVTAILLVAGGTQTFAGNSVNLAMPRLMAAFGTDLATTQWMTTGWSANHLVSRPHVFHHHGDDCPERQGLAC